MTPLRIAYVSPRLPSGRSVGGAETLLKHLAVLTGELGHKVRFLSTCATDHYSWSNDTEPGARIVDGLDVELFRVNGHRDLETFLRIQDSIMHNRQVSASDEAAWLKNGVNSDEMLAHIDQQAGSYDFIIGGPYLFGLIHSVLTFNRSRGVLLPCLHDEPFAYLDCFKQMFSSVRGVIFNTVPEKLLAERIMPGPLPPSSVVGFAVDKFEADNSTFRSRLPFSSPYVLYSGRREPMKGTPLLIDYIRTFRTRTGIDVRLVLTGKGRFDSMPADSSWLFDAGFLSEEDKHSAMAGAAAFCHPSTYESLGIVILEAWMAGTPCIVNAGSAVLTDQCRRSNGGLWFRCYPEFEEELLLCLKNGEIRDKLADAGRHFVTSEYSRAAVKQRLSAFLSSLNQ